VGGDITQNGTDAIRNVIIYDASKLTPVGPAALYYQNDTNRPSLAQTFKPATGAKADSQTFTVVVNHFRSKGSACGGALDDPLQGTCNGLRLLMAQNVQAWLSGNPTSDPAGATRRYLLIGDFNAYYGEDPIQSFVSNGFTSLIASLIGPNAYSYNFGSQAGYLDHALVNAAFLPLIKSVAELHVNADEPSSLEALDSNLKSATAQAAYFAADEFAASDHDPFVVALNPLAGDLNDDGVVDINDRNLIVSSYGKPASQVDRRMDYDGDGMISPNDYRIWFTYYRAFNQ
jgi:predicted extracellular nuclease